jgi:WD40 repeat protein
MVKSLLVSLVGWVKTTGVTWYPRKEVHTSMAQRRSHRRRPLVALLSCLGILGVFFSFIQNRDYFTRSAPRFVGQVAYSLDGKRLAWTSEGDGEGRFAIWDMVRNRQRLLIGPRDSERERTSVSTYTSLAFSPDGSVIATGTRSIPNPDPRVIVWDCQSGLCKQILRGHSDAVFAVAFAPVGGALASASRDRTVKLWDLTSGRERATLNAGTASVSSIAFSPDGRSIATGWSDRMIRVWDVQTGRVAALLQGHMQAVICVAYSPDGRTLASGGFDATLRLWDVQTGQERSVRGGFANVCRSVEFSPDGKTLAIKFAETSTGAFWDVETRQVRATFPNASAGLAFAPDGSILAVGGGARGRVYLITTSVDNLPSNRPIRTNPN